MFSNMVQRRMRMKWRASFCGSVWRKGVVCTFLLAKEGGVEQVSRWFRVEFAVSQTPTSQGVAPPWQFESSLSQISVPGSGVLTAGGDLCCDVDSQFSQGAEL